jgi:tRNA pseudouridine55 synthase
MDALFNVYKPRGPTSHDVVARLRRATGSPRSGRLRRIGHAGTLDPLAEGVLVVAAGPATRMLEYLAGTDKTYLARVTFGVETDTYDAEGRVTVERDASSVTTAQIEDAVARFRGTITQRPPAYSAISVGGQRLYDRARRGERVEAPSRQVQIERLDVRSWTPPTAEVFVECSKGTYVRSLAHDLGQALGTGAHLSGLIRTRVGCFEAGDSKPLEELEALIRGSEWGRVALPVDAALRHMPAVHLDAAAGRMISNGMPIPAGGDDAFQPGTLARAYVDGAFIAIVRRGEHRGAPAWRPEKVFARGVAGAAAS